MGSPIQSSPEQPQAPTPPRLHLQGSTRAGCGEKSSRSFPAVRKVTRVRREVGAPSQAPTGVPARAELDPSLLCGPKGLRGEGPGAGVAEEPARRARGSASHAGAGAQRRRGGVRSSGAGRTPTLHPRTQPEPERVAREQDIPGCDFHWTPLCRPSATRGGACTPQGPRHKAPGRCGGQQPKGMPAVQPCHPYFLLLLLLACWPQAPSAQVMDFLFEKWKLYSDQCHHNLSLLPAPTELVCNRTFDKYSCWPDTPPNTTANISCPWYLPWYHKVQHRLVFKECGPDGQWVRGPRGQPWRNASQCQMDDQEIEVQKEVAKMYSRFQMMYTVGYSLSLGALLLALAILLALSKLHCTRNYIHLNLFASFVLKAGSVLVIDQLLKIRYSQKIGDDLSVSVWLSDGAVAGCRMAAVIMQYGVVANYCWLLVEGMYLHSLLSLATFPERSFFTLYLGIGWGAPLLFVIPWVVVKCLFENIQCWTSNNNMGFWWILRVPVFLAILINFCIFVRIVHLLVAKLRARQMHDADYKFRLARSTLTLIPLLGVHEVVFAFVTDEQAQGTLRSAKLFFDLFLSSFQGLLVAVLYCFLNKEVQAELWRRWWRWREGKALLDERITGGHSAPTRPSHSPLCEKLQLVKGGSSKGASQDPCAETPLANGLPGLAKSPL